MTSVPPVGVYMGALGGTLRCVFSLPSLVDGV